MKLVLVISSFVLCVLLSELGLRVFFFIKMDYDIEMWRYARELKIAVSDSRSHIHRPNSQAQIMGAKVEINEMGFRDDSVSDYTNSILAIGDSFTFGFGVRHQETFTEILEARWHRPVVNAGVGNYNLEQELSFWYLVGRQLKPNHVIWSLYVNDGEPTQKYQQNIFLQYSYLLAFLKSLSNKLAALATPELDYVHTYQSLYEGPAWTQFEKNLQRLANAFQKTPQRLTVVLLPDLRNLKNYPFRNFHSKIGQFFKSHNIHVIDVLPAFEGQEERQFWVAPDDPHPNSLGHSLIAELIYKEIKL